VQWSQSITQKAVVMSLDRSLKVSTNLAGKRSVLTRPERIAKMLADKKFDPKKDKALGIAKTLVGKG
jgi:small basic protein (TIGR04137 family)